MYTGAVIAAAGMSTRMKQQKQLLQLGGLTLVERVVVTCRKAGIEEIVIVTGDHADRVKAALAGYELTFIKNEDYQTTDMFASVKLGLSRLQGRCDRVLFTPADVPLFEAGTVTALLSEAGDVIRPRFNGRGGHPIVLSAGILEELLNYQGAGGLKGALASLKEAVCVAVPVTDEGICFDADTPEDFRRLTEWYQSRRCEREQ